MARRRALQLLPHTMGLCGTALPACGDDVYMSHVTATYRQPAVKHRLPASGKGGAAMYFYSRPCRTCVLAGTTAFLSTWCITSNVRECLSTLCNKKSQCPIVMSSKKKGKNNFLTLQQKIIKYLADTMLLFLPVAMPY